jgi:hypothetical protein
MLTFVQEDPKPTLRFTKAIAARNEPIQSGLHCFPECFGRSAPDDSSLSSLNVRVERETELVDLISSKDGVSATLRKAGGESENVEALYLAGCDGAHSTVREKLQINFPGGTYSDLFYVADIQARGPAIHSPIGAIVYAKEPDFWNKGCQVKSIDTGFRSVC